VSGERALLGQKVKAVRIVASKRCVAALAALVLGATSGSCGMIQRLPAAPNAGLSVDVTDFAFWSPLNGLAFTASGAIITQDGGRRWQPVHAVDDPRLRPGISAGMPLARFVVEGRVLQTGTRAYRIKDGAWRPITGPPGQGVSALSFLSDSSAYAWSGGSFWTTSDGGGSWQSVSDLTHVPGLHMDSSTDGPFEGMLVDRLYGWMSSQFPPSQPAALFATTDGGRTWAPVTLQLAPGKAPDWLSTPRFFDSQRAVLYGYRAGAAAAGWAWTTSDRGRTWSAPIPLPAATFRASFADRLHWFVSAGARIFATGDGGATWSQLPRVATDWWELPIVFVDARHGFALVTSQDKKPSDPRAAGACCGPQQHHQLFATDDGGQTWRVSTTLPAPTPSPAR